jgi:leucyl aminopeptidase
MQTPSNLLSANDFKNNVVKQFHGLGEKVKIKILHKKDLEAKKMNLLLAVGSGSSTKNEPLLIVIDYQNSKSDKIALVGKGIIFDTGGLNLKPTSALNNMHGDMAGAAIVAGIVHALAKTKAQANVCAVIPLTSNDINEHSLRVNDVIHSYSGKTIEITNTDAEGRLILADGITYAIKDLKVSTVVSIATLTGGIVVALGNVFSGFWSTNEKLAQQVITAAKNGCEAT